MTIPEWKEVIKHEKVEQDGEVEDEWDRKLLEKDYGNGVEASIEHVYGIIDRTKSPSRYNLKEEWMVSVNRIKVFLVGKSATVTNTASISLNATVTNDVPNPVTYGSPIKIWFSHDETYDTLEQAKDMADRAAMVIGGIE